MSSTSSEQLTEEQQKFLESLEEEFKDRYTENDEEFKATLDEVPPLPPVVENWREFRQMGDRRDHFRDRSYDRRDFYGYNRHHGRSYQYHDDRYSHSSSHRGYHVDRSQNRYFNA